jgi:hypothetical protein
VRGLGEMKYGVPDLVGIEIPTSWLQAMVAVSESLILSPVCTRYYSSTFEFEKMRVHQHSLQLSTIELADVRKIWYCHTVGVCFPRMPNALVHLPYGQGLLENPDLVECMHFVIDHDRVHGSAEQVYRTAFDRTSQTERGDDRTH